MMAERSVRFGHVQMHQNHETHKPGYLKKNVFFAADQKKSRQQVHRVYRVLRLNLMSHGDFAQGAAPKRKEAPKGILSALSRVPWR